MNFNSQGNCPGLILTLKVYSINSTDIKPPLLLNCVFFTNASYSQKNKTGNIAIVLKALITPFSAL